MSRLSVTTAWNETAEIVKRDFGAMFTVALALIALPNVVVEAFQPTGAALGDPSRAGLWLLLVLVVLALTIAGTLAISSLALGRENVVGRAIAHGFRRAPALLGATLILGIVAAVILLPLLLLSRISAQELTAPTVATIGRLSLIVLVFCAVLILLWPRLLVMTPVAAAETAGPVAIIRRSWELTRGHFWKLLGFVLLIVIVFVVVMWVTRILFGILVAAILGVPEPGNLAGLVLSLLTSVVNAAVGVFLTTLVARIYLQLAESRTTGI